MDSSDRIGSPSAGSTRTVGNPYGIAAGCERTPPKQAIERGRLSTGVEDHNGGDQRFPEILVGAL
ncbi:MAG TPA: hypothetical protein VFL96_00610 [Acidobacteriaceae bacterium]|nr:hypothetical protein [Acidobacteriaceae bacterium]